MVFFELDVVLSRVFFFPGGNCFGFEVEILAFILAIEFASNYKWSNLWIDCDFINVNVINA